ncbi:MAG: hypothetical protein CMD06_02300, partial [Flavobacteriales bacterium]|nr:hypothetical protein [Flavobacteriales bacterium]
RRLLIDDISGVFVIHNTDTSTIDVSGHTLNLSHSSKYNDVSIICACISICFENINTNNSHL